MTIDVKKLRELLAAGTALPWKWDDHPWFGRDLIHEQPWKNVIHVAHCSHPPDKDLIAAAVNALDQLLAVYETAQVWRDSNRGMTTLSGPERALARAVDATSREPT